MPKLIDTHGEAANPLDVILFPSWGDDHSLQTLKWRLNRNAKRTQSYQSHLGVIAKLKQARNLPSMLVLTCSETLCCKGTKHPSDSEKILGIDIVATLTQAYGLSENKAKPYTHGLTSTLLILKQLQACLADATEVPTIILWNKNDIPEQIQQFLADMSGFEIQNLENPSSEMFQDLTKTAVIVSPTIDAPEVSAGFAPEEKPAPIYPYPELEGSILA
ncbi:MAG: hypothetical protein AAF204_04945 [Pseudomonadota bacterium]